MSDAPLAQNRRMAMRAATAAVTLKLLILVVFALNTRFVMDEFWTLQQSYHLFRDTFVSVWPEKTVLYAAFYKLSAVPGWDGARQVLFARGLSAGLAVALAGVVYATARAMGQGRGQALAAVLVLLSFSTFLERGFRLRSEPLAILFAASALWVVLRCGSDRARGILVAGLLSGLAFATTQKSIYFNVALGSALVIDALAARNWREAIRRSVVLLAGWAIALLAYAILFGGSAAFDVLRLAAVGPLAVATTAQNYYSGFGEFVAQTLVRNLPLYAASFAGMALAVIGYFRLGSAARIHLVATLVITVLVFLHNQPWPYVFTMALPFLAPYGGVLWGAISSPSHQRLLVLLFGITVVASFGRNLYYLGHDNTAQLQLIRSAEAEMPPSDTYFDGIGFLPNREMAPFVWLDAMNVAQTIAAGEDSEMMRALRADKPALIIASYRTEALGELLDPYLSEHFQRIAPNLWQRTDLAQNQPAVSGTLIGLFEGVYTY